MERLRAGVIGCGAIAQMMHLPYLRELDDRSHDEVAATLGVSRGASKTLVHRAKANVALAA